MKCLRPLYALDTGAINEETGKRHIHLLPKRCDLYSLQSLEERYGEGNILTLPCGQCVNCRTNYARMWALRCVCESTYHEENYFVTLTYSPENYPGHLVKSDLQKFFKRVRKYRKFSYFACGEYGDNFNRAHYHVIMFGLHLDDLKCIGKGPKGGYYYESKFLNKLWPFGFVTIGDVNFTTCNYVAKYCVKKIGKQEVEGYPSFLLMSTKPAIGLQYFVDHWQSMYKSDALYISSGNQYRNKIPRYFDKWLDVIKPDLFKEIQNQRLSTANALEVHDLLKYGFEHREQSLDVAVQVALNKMKDLNRRKR